ncbi:DUF6792 domain-containing protein [Terribacillus sp. 179-K 1B1 HS]|uniref:DUF6792 domain-containing protein n=1 Tax=Terribacillus sp. 179-K 1B1 HS TaxID=3142388 RepID=UPI0039A2EA25
MAENILDYKSVSMRLTNEEYKNMDAAEMESKIKQIYLEETGSLLDADIKIFHTSDSNNKLLASSGYDGTAIYVDDGKQEEMYVISQGSTNGPDWSFNAKGVFAGESTLQPSSTDSFVNEAKKYFNVDEDTKVISWGHSLGHHNNSTSLLGSDTFDEVYGMNGAQVNAYELFEFDKQFRKAVREEFEVQLKDELRDTVPPDKLEQFTKNFYKDKSDKIHQVISEDDPLNGLTPYVPGIVEIGEVEVLDTNPDVVGIRELAKDIPPEVIKDIQDIVLTYAKADNAGGTKGVVEELFGVNWGYVKDIDNVGEFLAWRTFNRDEYNETMGALSKNVPPLLDKFRVVLENKESIFGSLQEEGYITQKGKDAIINELETWESYLSVIEASLESSANTSGFLSLQNVADSGLYGSIIWLVTAFPDAKKRLEESGFMDSMHDIVASHGIPELLAAMSDGIKSYHGTDMVYTATNGDPIKVNISAALRMYRETLPILEEKETKIRNFEQVVKEELDDSYKDEKRKVQDEIDRMESSPNSYRDLLAKHGHLPAFNKEMKTIKIHEVFYPLENNDFDEEIHELKKSVESGKLYIEKYRKAIEDLFDEEDNLSRLFDFSRRF